MSAGEEEHDIKIKVEDVNDSEGEGLKRKVKVMMIRRKVVNFKIIKIIKKKVMEV